MSWKGVRAPMAVGVLVVVGLIAMIYMVSMVKTSVATAENSYTVYAIFEDVTGLVVKSNVTMVGIPVGVVESLDRVETPDGARARVGIRINPDVVLYAGEVNERGILTGSASVIRKQSSILGDFYLALTPGALGPKLGPGDEIPVVIGTSGVEAVLEQAGKLSELYPKLDRIADNVERLTRGAADVLGGEEGRKAMSEIVENLRQTSKDMQAISANARMVAEEARWLVDEGTIRAISDNVQAVTADARIIADRFTKIVEAGDVDALVKNLTETSKKLTEIGGQLETLIAEGVEPRLDQLDRIFRNFEHFSGTLSRFTDKNVPGITAAIENFRLFSDELVTLVREGRKDFEAAMSVVQSSLTAAERTLVRFDEAVDNVRVITDGLRQGKGTIGHLLTDDKLIREVEEIVTDTKDFVKSYTLMQTEVRMSTSYFWEQSSMKNVFEIRLVPKEDKYYLLQIVDDPRGYTTDQYVVTESNALDKPPVTKERVETTSHNLKLTFQFAKSFYFVTGRFGIMENTGGLGLDFNFFHDRLNFQFDLFDFTLNTNPRLRAEVEWEVFNNVFIAGGADDILNDDYRDYYFTIGIQFTDEDLKSLLMATPSINF